MKKFDRNNLPQWLIDLPGNCQNQEWHHTHMYGLIIDININISSSPTLFFFGRMLDGWIDCYYLLWYYL